MLKVGSMSRHIYRKTSKIIINTSYSNLIERIHNHILLQVTFACYTETKNYISYMYCMHDVILICYVS